MKSRKKKGKEFLHVTLYGVSSETDIEFQFLQQLHPKLLSTTAMRGINLVKGWAKDKLKLEEEDLLKPFLNPVKNKILIFDDFERCEIPEKILGYINTFVEHHHQKVIILGNEKEIVGNFDFEKKSEKLIGRRFTLNADFTEAFASFISKLRDQSVKKILETNTNLIEETFQKAKCNNLRTLRYSIFEYERFFSFLPPLAKTHELFQERCLATFFSLSIEIRSGNFDSEDLNKIADTYQKAFVEKAVSKKEKPVSEESKNVIEFYERVFGANHQEIIPSIAVLHDFFEFGSISKDLINESIDQCSFFYNDTTPVWMRLWRIWHISDSDFATFYPMVRKEFEEFRFTIQGEFKHVAALLLFFSKNSLVSEKLIVTKRMVDRVTAHMATENLFEVISDEEIRNHGFSGNGYMSLGFTDPQNPAFQDVCRKIEDYQSRRAAEQYKSLALEIPKQLRDKGARELTNELMLTNHNTTRLTELPVLADVPLEEFLDSLIAVGGDDKARLMHAIKERYILLRPYPQLAKELPWLKALKKLLTKKLPSIGQPTRYQLEEFNRNALIPAVKTIQEFIKTEAEEKNNK